MSNLPIPHGADRLAEPGETCTCGRPAVVTYLSTPTGLPVGFCGQSNVAPLDAPTFDEYADARYRVDYGEARPGDEEIVRDYEREVLNPAHAAYTQAVRNQARCAHCGADVKIVGGRFVSHTRPQGDHCRDSGRPLHGD